MLSPEFKQKYGPWCVIAGASTGIGASFSVELAQKGVNLVMIALSGTRLSSMARSLEQRYNIQTVALELDLSSADVMDCVGERIQGLEIGLLVYVACHSVIGEFLDVPLSEKLKIVDVNVRAPLLFVDALVPAMVSRGRGGIILMSSVSGWQGTAMVSTYAATKAFNTNLAEGLWSELGEHGIDVLAMVAGATHTPTFDLLTPADKQKTVYPMQPDEVAQQALARLANGPVQIAGRLNRLVSFISNRLLSRKAAVQFISANTKRVYRK